MINQQLKTKKSIVPGNKVVAVRLGNVAKQQALKDMLDEGLNTSYLRHIDKDIFKFGGHEIDF